MDKITVLYSCFPSAKSSVPGATSDFPDSLNSWKQRPKKLARKQETNKQGSLPECKGWRGGGGEKKSQRMKLSQTVTSELFFWWENFSICPSMGLLFLGNNSKCPEKNAFLRVHPELGIHWYHTHLSLTNTPIYHHPWMSTNSRFNWTTFSHSRLNIATLISVFPLWHRMMEWLGSRARIWGTWDLGIGACRSRKMPGGAQGRVVGVRSNLGKRERCQNPWFCRRVGCR